MAYNALTDDATLAVLRYGYTVFVPAVGQTQVALTRAAVHVVEPLDYNKIVAGAFVEMSAPEKAAVDAANAATGKQESIGAAQIDRSVPTTADLATPPSRVGLMVCIDNVGGGVKGFAISDATGWDIYPSARHIP